MKTGQEVAARKIRTTFCTYMCLPISPSESSENNLTGSETFALCKRNKPMFIVRELPPLIIPDNLEIISYKAQCSE